MSRKGTKKCWFSPTFQVLFDIRHGLFPENRTLDARFLLGTIVREQADGILSEKDNGDQVADSHQSHRDVRQTPYQIECGDRPEKYHAADQYPVGVEHPFLCGDETDIRFAVIIISQDTAECEEEQRYGNKDASGSTDLIRERLLGQLHPIEEPSKGAPLKRMINAVQVQINKVSVNTASVCINPCLTG